MVTTTEKGSWVTFPSEGRRDLIQEDIDSAITRYSEHYGQPRYAAVNSKYRDTKVQDYLVSQGIIPRFALGIGSWEIWLSTLTLVLTGEGLDILPAFRNGDYTDEERERFYTFYNDPDDPTASVEGKKQKRGKGRTKIMHQGMPREEWIQQEYAKGRKRRDIADELNVRYQIVFAATKHLPKQATETS